MNDLALRPRRRALRTVVLPLVVAGALVAGCTPSDVKKAVEPAKPVELGANVAPKATDVAVDTLVQVTARHGEVERATLRDAEGKQTIEGKVVDGQWKAGERLEPGTTYTLSAVGRGDDDATQRITRTFTTRKLTLAQQTYPSVAPLKDETVGVGMPVIVTFDVPVKNRALFEEHMHVRTDKDVVGSWSWLSDREVHYRPKNYWPADTKVTIDLDLNSLPAGNGVYGQQDQKIPFTVGSRMVSVVDVAKHSMRVTKDGRTIRRIPVTTGDPGHRTRSGTKVIMEKHPSVDMDAASTGVDADAPDYYNIAGVKWAMRLTNSGEFIHAAPWSTAAQGRANVSHGCTGMSTANAAWIYARSKRGDVVRFVNSPRPLEDRNGWTDWDVSWSDWLKGSAIQEGQAPSTPTPSPTTVAPTAAS
ncbi:MAG: Ig-like domain-containing protein [Aeromicrobium erythreum]